MKTIKVGNLEVGNDKPFVLIAGLNVLEDDETIKDVIEECIRLTKKYDIPYIFKASYDKANRSSIDSYRGPGVEKGLKKLLELKKDYKVPLISDIHKPEEAELASNVLDIIQIPAFLSRQTDLIEAACSTSLPINIKKGQFLSPDQMKNIIEKCFNFGNDQVMLCERGTSFGYDNLVVDMLGISKLKTFKCPIIFDVTHSLQLPGGLGSATGGRREHVLSLAKAGISQSIAGLFLEAHPNPDEAKCDGPCAISSDEISKVLNQLVALDEFIKNQFRAD